MRRATALLALVLLVCPAVAGAQVPGTLSYQGVLRDDAGNVVPDGNYDLTFRIYDTLTGGTPLWYETQGVAVTDGMVNVVLGAVVPVSLAFDRPHWLGVSVEGQSELAPRTELASVPYAHRAGVADALQGGSGDTDWTESGGDVYRLDGNVGIGVEAPWKRLHIKETLDGGLSYALKIENPGNDAGTATGILFKVDSSNEDRGKGGIVYERVNTWNRGKMHFLQNSAANASQATLADAALTINNNRNVGVGTTDPKAKLEVAGHIRSTTYAWPASGKGLELAYNDAQNKGYVFAYDRDLQEYGDLALGSGNVGIGTNYPAEQLHVDGVIYSASGGIKFPDGTVQTTATGGTGGGLELPYAGTAATTAPAFSATNNGSGRGVYGYGATVGVEGEASGGDYGYLGYSSAGVYGNGATRGVVAYADAGTGVYAECRLGAGLRAEHSNGNIVDCATGTQALKANNHLGYVVELANETVALRADGPGSHAAYLGGEDYGVKSEGDLVVEGAYRGTIGPNNGAPFPRPAYDSGWQSIDPGETITLDHNVGYPVDDLVVDLQFKDVGVLINRGINNWYHGGDSEDPNTYKGAAYQDLTSTQISVIRFDDDVSLAGEVRVRIWAYE